MSLDNHIFSGQSELVSAADKSHLLSHRGIVVWMTGYSGAGKSTLAYHLEKRLHDEGILTAVLDGDVLRQGLNAGLGFSLSDRRENIRRTAELAKQLANCGVVVICSLITPTNELRALAEDIIGQERFILYHIATPLSVCEERDVKGFYAKARQGEIKDFTGVTNPFEEPKNALYTINPSSLPIQESVAIMFDDIFPLLAI